MKKQSFIYVVFMLALLLAACAKENGTGEAETAKAVIEMEIAQEMPEEEAEAPDSAVDNMEGKADTSEETEETNMQSDAGAEPVTEEPGAKQQKEGEQTRQQPPAEQENSPAEQPAATATLNGKIVSVTDGGYVVKRADVVNSDVMVSHEDAAKVTVVYTDMTEFVLCTTSDGGITADYGPATSADLGSGKMTEAQGAYEGNNFVAQKVTIFHFL